MSWIFITCGNCGVVAGINCRGDLAGYLVQCVCCLWASDCEAG